MRRIWFNKILVREGGLRKKSGLYPFWVFFTIGKSFENFSRNTYTAYSIVVASGGGGQVLAAPVQVRAEFQGGPGVAA